MIVSLDYDETFTRDPDTWFAVCNVLRLQGHTVFGVTMRGVNESHNMNPLYFDACDEVCFTDRKAKRNYMNSLGIIVDVWIDDSPEFVLNSAARR